MKRGVFLPLLGERSFLTGITHSPSQKGAAKPCILWHVALGPLTAVIGRSHSLGFDYDLSQLRRQLLKWVSLHWGSCHRSPVLPPNREMLQGEAHEEQPPCCWVSCLPRAEKQGACDLQVITKPAKTAHYLSMWCHASYTHNLVKQRKPVLFWIRLGQTNQKAPRYQSV